MMVSTNQHKTNVLHENCLIHGSIYKPVYKPTIWAVGETSGEWLRGDKVFIARMRWAVQCMRIKIHGERTAATFIAAVATAVQLMLLRRLENVMAVAVVCVAASRSLPRAAHTLRSPILIIIMTALQLACGAAAALYYWCGSVSKGSNCAPPWKNSSAKPFVTVGVGSELVRVGGSRSVFHRTGNLVIYTSLSNCIEYVRIFVLELFMSCVHDVSI